MANRWGNNGNSDRLFSLGSKITADADFSHEIKRHLLLGRKVITNLDSTGETHFCGWVKGDRVAPSPDLRYLSSSLPSTGQRIKQLVLCPFMV